MDSNDSVGHWKGWMAAQDFTDPERRDAWETLKVAQTGTQLTHALNVEPLSMHTLEVAAYAATLEVQRQQKLAEAGKFGWTHILPSGPNPARLAVLAEEFGEVSREINESLIGAGWKSQRLFDELVQTAACSIAWAAALMREGAVLDFDKWRPGDSLKAGESVPNLMPQHRGHDQVLEEAMNELHPGIFGEGAS